MERHRFQMTSENPHLQSQILESPVKAYIHENVWILLMSSQYQRCSLTYSKRDVRQWLVQLVVILKRGSRTSVA